MTNSFSTLPPALAAKLTDALRHNSGLVAYALRYNLLRPHDCDPDCPAHIHGIHQALHDNPGLDVPEAVFARMSQDTLWSLLQIPAVVSHLAGRLMIDGCTLGPHDIAYIHRHTRPVPPPLETALLNLARADRLTTEQLDAMREKRWFSQAGSDMLAALRRTRSAHKAAATRRANAAQHGSSTGSPSAARRGPRDPLLAAIQSGDAARLKRFDLTTRTRAQIDALLPIWLHATPSIRAHLATIPNLPPDIQAAGLNACAESQSWPYPLAPLSSDLLPLLTEDALVALLDRYAQQRVRPWGAIMITPAPDDATLTTALFRITLVNPRAAALLTEKLTLAAWMETLHALPDRTDTTPPADSEATWIEALSMAYTQETLDILALEIYRRAQTWPTDRLIALKPALVKIAAGRLESTIR